jgi:RNA-binding protein YhbY
MLPQIAEKFILFNSKTHNELKIKANLVEQSLKVTQEGTNDGTLLNISKALNSLSQIKVQ